MKQTLDLLKKPRKNKKYSPKGTLVRPKIKNHLKQNQETPPTPSPSACSSASTRAAWTKSLGSTTSDSPSANKAKTFERSLSGADFGVFSGFFCLFDLCFSFFLLGGYFLLSFFGGIFRKKKWRVFFLWLLVLVIFEENTKRLFTGSVVLGWFML